MARNIILSAILFFTVALNAAAQSPSGPDYAEILDQDGRALKKVRIDRREEVVDGKRFLLRGSYVHNRDGKYTVVYERTEDMAVEDCAERRSSQTTLFTWYGPDGFAVASRRFGGRFVTVALSDSGEFLAAVDRGCYDIPIHSGLPPSEARAERELAESRLYVFDRSWRTVYSTSALRADWDQVWLSPSGSWLLYETADENDNAGGNGWSLTAAELESNRTFKLSWERDLYFIKIENDGLVSAQRFLGLTAEKVPMQGPNGTTVMARKPIYLKFIWKPGKGGRFRAVKSDPE